MRREHHYDKGFVARERIRGERFYSFSFFAERLNTFHLTRSNKVNLLNVYFLIYILY